MDLGFTISASTQQAIMIVFILYTAIIVGLGAYVKFASRNENSSQKLAGFLTGGGNLGSLAVGLIMVTNIMSSGGMVGGPGMSYGTGFIWSLCVFCSFINIFMSLGSVGKKMSILGRRTGAQTVLGLFRHRYQSKVFSTFLGLSFIIFLIPYSASQFTGGGRLFAVVTGTGNYRIGVLLFAVITLVYTLTGGIKSISKIAVFQGAIMIFSVISIYVVTGGRHSGGVWLSPGRHGVCPGVQALSAGRHHLGTPVLHRHCLCAELRTHSAAPRPDGDLHL